MALNQEQWLSDIQENLFKNNVIINKAQSHDAFVNYKTVHVPQAGANPTVTKNLGVFPASIVQRTDSELTYNMDSYYLTPILIEKGQETAFISYDKRMSVLNQHIKTLEQTLTNQALYKWAGTGASRIVRTTGAADALALAPSATGTRKAITLADISKAKGILDKDNVPQEGRILVMDSDIYNAHFLAISNVQSAYAYGSAVLPNGVVGKIFGFDIVIRSTVTVFDNTGTPVIKTIGDNGEPTAPAATDNIGCIAYHPNFVAKAMGDTTVMINENVAEYYGSIISSLQLFGASKLRTNQEGIVSIVQAA
jgi:Phage capsid protein